MDEFAEGVAAGMITAAQVALATSNTARMLAIQFDATATEIRDGHADQTVENIRRMVRERRVEVHEEFEEEFDEDDEDDESGWGREHDYGAMCGRSYEPPSCATPRDWAFMGLRAYQDHPNDLHVQVPEGWFSRGVRIDQDHALELSYLFGAFARTGRMPSSLYVPEEEQA